MGLAQAVGRDRLSNRNNTPNNVQKRGNRVQSALDLVQPLQSPVDLVTSRFETLFVLNKLVSNLGKLSILQPEPGLLHKQ